MRHRPELVGKPVALVDAAMTKPSVVEVNFCARRLAVEMGMTPTQALARCAELNLLSPSPSQERSACDVLLQTAETLSPFLELTMRGVVTIELPIERVFGEDELTERLIDPLRSLGMETQVGVAGTPDLALLAARVATPAKIVVESAEFLAPLPIASLEPSKLLADILDSWGIRTIGQFRALPAGQTWERLGPEAVALGQRARGGCLRPLRLVKPPEFFIESIDLEYAVETLEPLLFLLRRFLEQITTRLIRTWMVVGKMRLILRFDQSEPVSRLFSIPQPTCDVDLLFRLLHTYLEGFTADSSVVGLELAAEPVRPLIQQRGLLDRGLRDPHQFAETLARLQALLGTDEVGRPQLELSHHPDAFAVRPYDPEAAAPDNTGQEILLGVPWLRFRPPVPARVILEAAKPFFLCSSLSTGPIHGSRGPWRLAGHWWQEDKHWAREEWDIETADGVYRLIQSDSQWYLDGVYA